jgi:hypothetical protein
MEKVGIVCVVQQSCTVVNAVRGFNMKRQLHMPCNAVLLLLLMSHRVLVL